MFSVAIDADGAVVFAKPVEMGLEGIVSKRLGGAYWSGRVKNWVKVKKPGIRETMSRLNGAGSSVSTMAATGVGLRKGRLGLAAVRDALAEDEHQFTVLVTGVDHAIDGDVAPALALMVGIAGRTVPVVVCHADVAGLM